ncbi:MAG: glycosyltransferase [Bacteroidota bacterium]|nr:glycosyltransferase [Bacteroidota bacterium]
MNDIALSICMITFNHEKYIGKAIEGVLKQKTSFSFELLIGEDCSSDNTRNIVKEYETKYPEIISAQYPSTNRGMVNNFLSILQYASGKYIALCEGDDYWTDPYKLQKQVDFLENNPDYGMISSDIILVDSNGDRIEDTYRVFRQRKYRKPKVSFFDLLQMNLVNTLTVCVRSQLIKEVIKELLKDNIQAIYDYSFWLNIARKSLVRITEEKTAAYRIHNKGVSNVEGFLSSLWPEAKYYAIVKYCKDNNQIISKDEEYILINTIYILLRLNILSNKKKKELLSIVLSKRKYVLTLCNVVYNRIKNKIFG